MKHSIRQIHNYLTKLSVPDDPVIEEGMRFARERGLPPIHVSLHTGKLLCLLVSLAQPKRVLEVGTLGGVSTMWIARALTNQGKMVSVDKSQEAIEVAQENIDRAGLGEKVELYHSTIQSLLPSLEGDFDFVFLDAERSEYPDYLEQLLDKICSGGLLIIDNVLRNGKVLNPCDPSIEALAALNQHLADHPRLDLLIVPTFGGLKGGMLDGLALLQVH